MGKGNKPPFATGKFNFGSALIFSGNAARRSRSCGNHQDSHTKQEKDFYFHQRFPTRHRIIL
jgi:hypothetical protein